MDKKLYEQITNLIEKSQKILILAHARVDCDGLGAALSSYLVLKELGKESTVVTNDPAPENLQFLPSIDILQNSMTGSTDFIITVDSSDTAIGKIKYNVENDKVNIIITPKDGSFDEKNVSFSHGSNQYDLILVLDTGNLEHLGPIYDKNVEMFYETPIINIDHHVSNTDFGQVNLVDSTASSTTEILYEYLSYLEKKYDKKLITENIATLLLAGIITDTGSFQHANTSPRAMETSSKLLDLGARQQEIIKNIYKTKKLSTLKLWGIILSKVQVNPVYKMVWSTISKDDLQEANADPIETEGIIDDLLTNAPGAEIIFLIKQNPEYTSVSMRSTNNQTDVGMFCANNGGGGHVRAAGFKVYSKKPFDQVVSEVIGKVQKFQAERLNIYDEDAIEDLVDDPIKTTKEDQKSDTTEVLNNAVKDERVLPKSEKKQNKKETYLDFNKPNKPKKAQVDKEINKPLANITKSSNNAIKNVHVRTDNQQIENTSAETPKKRKRKRKRKPKKKKEDTTITTNLNQPVVTEKPKSDNKKNPQPNPPKKPTIQSKPIPTPAPLHTKPLNPVTPPTDVQPPITRQPKSTAVTPTQPTTSPQPNLTPPNIQPAPNATYNQPVTASSTQQHIQSPAITQPSTPTTPVVNPASQSPIQTPPPTHTANNINPVNPPIPTVNTPTVTTPPVLPNTSQAQTPHTPAIKQPAAETTPMPMPTPANQPQPTAPTQQPTQTPLPQTPQPSPTSPPPRLETTPEMPDWLRADPPSNPTNDDKPAPNIKPV